MKGIRFIKAPLHGILDYLVDITLILGPFLLEFPDRPSAIIFVPVGIGTANLIYSLLTGYSRGLVALIPFRIHLALDFIVGLVLIAIPIVYSVEGIPALFHFLMGGGIVAAVAVTDPDSATTG